MLLGNQTPPPHCTAHPTVSSGHRPLGHPPCGGIRNPVPKRPGSVPGLVQTPVFLCPSSSGSSQAEETVTPQVCAPPRRGDGGRHTFVPLQDILVGLEVLLLVHAQVGGRGEVPRHAQAYLSGGLQRLTETEAPRGRPGWELRPVSTQVTTSRPSPWAARPVNTAVF